MKTLLFALATLIAGSAFAAPRILVHGHRGTPALRPENTIPSFEEAIRAGADYIEMDIYATRDNKLVVAHDPTINMALCQGPSGKKPIRSLTLEEVRQYDCGSLKHQSFPRQVAVPGTKIPTFDEVLDLGKKYPKIRFNIEIKSNEKWKDYTPEPDEFCQMVAAAIRSHKMQKRVLVQSFDFRIVKAMKKAGPEFERAALIGGGTRTLADIAKETAVKMVNPMYKMLTAENVKEAHAAGIRMMAWTPDTVEDWDRLIAIGVDGIITNDPEGLVQHLKAKGLR